MHPKTITPADIASAMQMTESEVWAFARNMDASFKPTRLQLVGKKERPIDAPYDAPKKKLKRLHRWFQERKLFHPAAHGSISGSSCFTSARRHLGKKFVWTRDATNCYPSVRPSVFKAELKRLGFRHDTASLMTLLCTLRGKIPQGSPTSGDALNLFFARADQHAASFAGANRLSHTRVADDFVVSGNSKASGDKVVRIIEEEVAARGININDKKRRESGFQPRSKPQLVHSIRVDNRRGTQISGDHHKIAIEVAASYVASCRGLQPQSLGATAAKRLRLHGYLHYFRQAKFSAAKHLRQQLNLGDRIVARKLNSLRISADKNKWWVVNRKRNEPKRITRIWESRLRSTAPTAD
ncbi:MAG: reverse transcriptase domain-containing protein [Candidatus Paceibacterota bacterium]